VIDAGPAVRTLIIGSTSAIGEAIANELADLGAVRTAGRRDADFEFDLAEPINSLPSAETFEVAVLVAADFGGPHDDDFIRATSVNVVGSLAACRLAHNAGVRHFVLISSVSATYVPGDSYFGIYSLSKRQSEEVVAFYCQQQEMTLTIIRPTGVYDTAGRCRSHQGLFYGIVDRASTGDDFTINGSVDPQRNYLHVSDLARIVRRVVEVGQPGTYTCSHPESATIGQIAALAYKVFANGGAIRFDSSKPDIPATPPLPASDLYDDLSTWPSVSLQDGLCQIRDFRAGGHRT
jgi:nucleoside-diphosphate-sugar epimerase